MLVTIYGRDQHDEGTSSHGLYEINSSQKPSFAYQCAFCAARSWFPVNSYLSIPNSLVHDSSTTTPVSIPILKQIFSSSPPFFPFLVYVLGATVPNRLPTCASSTLFFSLSVHDRPTTIFTVTCRTKYIKAFCSSPPPQIPKTRTTSPIDSSFQNKTKVCHH